MNREKFGKSNWFILILFGLIGQIAWAVENMYFNTFVFNTIEKNLSAITLMVQLSGVTATVVTLVAGTLSDKIGNRRRFISIGYLIWGITVAPFGFISPELTASIFGVGTERAIEITLAIVIIGDCVMTAFGSTANDASFNAWVTDNTKSAFRGTVEGVLAILPLVAMLIVAGGFGILVEAVGYRTVFLIMGIVISLCGGAGLLIIKDSPALQRSGSMKNIFYGFRPAVIRANSPLYISLLIVLVYGIACQIFMPYLIIYMNYYLGFSVPEYSVVFALAILLGAGVNLYLTRLSDRREKTGMLYIAVAIFGAGLIAMYFSRGLGKMGTLVAFGIAGFVMICGNIFISALTGSLVRDYTPDGEVGKLQGVRMVFSVLIPMLLGPMIGNLINSARNIPLPDMDSADSMTTSYIPAPEIFLAAGLLTLVLLLVVPLLKKSIAAKKNCES
ncbi:MAG: MFS transporter [Clostridia bacterium]|nr:MFS transporter [Clostridia bacterium]